MLRAANSSIKRISLSGHTNIDDKCMRSLGEYIKSNIYIGHIDISWNPVTDTGVEILAPYLYDNTTFKQLNLFGNKGITDKSIPMLIKIIESSHIEYIYIKRTSITQWNVLVIPLAYNVLKSGSNKLDLWNK